MGGSRDEHLRRTQLGVPGEELLDAERLEALAPHGPPQPREGRRILLAHGHRDLAPQLDRLADAQVDELPLAVLRQLLLQRSDRSYGSGREFRPLHPLPQGDAVELHGAEVPQRLVVRHGAARRQVAPGAGVDRGVDVEAEHGGEVPAGVEFMGERDRRRLLAHVVGVVEGGEDPRHEPGDEQVRTHVPHVARVEDGHGPLELSRQPDQRLPGAGLRLQEVRPVGGRRGDPVPVLRVKVPPPEGVIAHELDDQLLEPPVVLPRGPQKERLEKVELLPQSIAG